MVDNSRKGQLIIEAALLFPLILLLLALIIDAGLWTHQLTRIQGAATAACMAAAGSDTPEDEAIRIAGLWGYEPAEVETIVGETEITVLISREGHLFFAGLFMSEPPMLRGLAYFARY